MRTSFSPAILAVTVFAWAAAAQGDSAAIAALHSPVDSVRTNAFYSLMRAASRGVPRSKLAGGLSFALLAERAKSNRDLGDGLISLLERENEYVASFAGRGVRLPESFDGEGYYPDLMLAVAAMHDQRTIGALMPGIAFSGPVVRVVAEFGAKAVPFLIHGLADANRDTRAGAAVTLRLLLDSSGTGGLSGADRRAIRDALLRSAVSRDDAFVRQQAVVALGWFSDDTTRLAMKRLASSDTAMRVSPNGKHVYPVRAAAQNWMSGH